MRVAKFRISSFHFSEFFRTSVSIWKSFHSFRRFRGLLLSLDGLLDNSWCQSSNSWRSRGRSSDPPLLDGSDGIFSSRFAIAVLCTHEYIIHYYITLLSYKEVTKTTFTISSFHMRTSRRRHLHFPLLWDRFPRHFIQYTLIKFHLLHNLRSHLQIINFHVT